jgi:hypothetical protein|nr:MAG TPA: hypothetical protein [Caudoviricetes sp.]
MELLVQSAITILLLGFNIGAVGLVVFVCLLCYKSIKDCIEGKG